MKEIIKRFIKKNYKNLDLLKNLKMPLLNFNFVMTCIIHKMLVLIKNNLITLKIVFSNAFLRSIINLIFLKN